MIASQDRLSQGMAALKAGRKPEAEHILKEVVQHDPLNSDAWLWLGAAVSAPNETLYCLERVLEIDPGNEKAKAGVKWAATQVGTGKAVAVSPIAGSPPGQRIASLTESIPVPSADGVDALIEIMRSQGGQDVGTEALFSDTSSATEPQQAGSFFPNLLIAALALILLLGILLIAALLRAWLA